MSERTLSRIASCLALAAGALAAGGAALAGDIEVVDAWSRPTPPGAEAGVVYFTITNRGRSDRLVGASSPVAERAELHISQMEGGVMKMRPLAAVEVKKGAPTSFEPSGRHVMLTGLRKPLKRGDAFPLVLRFAKAGSVKVQVRVGQAGAISGHPEMNMGGSMERSR